MKINETVNRKIFILWQNDFWSLHTRSCGYSRKIKKISFVGKTWLIRCQILNKIFIKNLVEKASIGINGVSLTISKVDKNYFEINVIPHTLKLTNLKNLKINDLVNVELDIFGKYMYKYLLNA